MIEVTLNTEKHGMCFIGSLSFTVDEPGPIKLNLDNLSTADTNQLLYNYRRGVLVVDNPDELLQKEALPAASKNFVTPAERPLTTKNNRQIRDIIEEDNIAIRKILRGNIDDIKEAVETMPVGQIRRLIDLETKTKNRKKLLEYVNEILNKHAKNVMDSVGDDQTPIQSEITPAMLQLPNFYAGNITDVVDSEIEQVVLNPITEE